MSDATKHPIADGPYTPIGEASSVEYSAARDKQKAIIEHEAATGVESVRRAAHSNYMDSSTEFYDEGQYMLPKDKAALVASMNTQQELSRAALEARDAIKAGEHDDTLSNLGKDGHPVVDLTATPSAKGIKVKGIEVSRLEYPVVARNAGEFGAAVATAKSAVLGKHTSDYVSQAVTAAEEGLKR